MYCAFFCAIASNAQQLNGIVVNEENEPIAGAKITVENSMLETFSDEKGKFKIMGIKGDNARLFIQSRGYKMQVFGTGVVSEEEQVFKLSANENLIDEVEILSVRANHYSAQSYTDLNKEKIRENNLGLDMPYVLNMTPSVVVTSDAGAGVGYTGIRIRGSDNSRINVTINGMPLNDAESQGTYWVDLPDFASSADNIQIQRGIGTSTNGAGAFGASINVNTNQLKVKPYGESHNSFGSFNTLRNTLAFGTGLINGHFTVDGRLSSITSDGYIDRAASNLKAFYTSLAWIGKKSNLRFNLFSGKEKTYQAWYGVYQDSLKTNRTYNPYTYQDQTDNYLQTHYQFFWNTRINKNFSTTLSLYHTDGKGYYQEYKDDQYFSSYGLNDVYTANDTIYTTDLVRRRWLDNDLFGGNFALNYESARFKSVTGGGYNKYKGNHYGQVVWAEFASNSTDTGKYYNNSAVKEDLNIFTKNTLFFGAGISAFIDLQFRNVNYTFVGLNDVFELDDQTVNYAFFNPKAGITYDMNNRNNFYASFGIGNREPNRADFVDSRPSNYPKAESMQDLEAGYNFNGRLFSVSANIYYMNYKNQLVLTGKINDVGSYIRENVEKSFRRGIELQARFVPIKQIEWNANFTYSQNKVGSYTEFIDAYDSFGGFEQIEVKHENKDLAFSPNIIAGSELKFNLIHKMVTYPATAPYEIMEINAQKSRAGHKLSLSFLSKYVGEQYLDNTQNSARMLNAYFTQDIRLRYELTTIKQYTIALYVQAINVLNKLYESNGYVYPYYFDGELYNDKWYYPQAGINYLGGISLIF